MKVRWFLLKVTQPIGVWTFIDCPSSSFNFSPCLLSLSNRKSSTVPDSVAMTMLARKRTSPVIQVTVKQTETDPGLIGVVSDIKIWTPENINIHRKYRKHCVDLLYVRMFNHMFMNSLPFRTVRSQMRGRLQKVLIFLWVWLRYRWVTIKGKIWLNEWRNTCSRGNMLGFLNVLTQYFC